MSNVTIQKRGNFYQYKFEIAKVDETRKDVSNVFDNLMSFETINDIIKYEIAY